LPSGRASSLHCAATSPRSALPSPWRNRGSVRQTGAIGSRYAGSSRRCATNKSGLVRRFC
jgi:hypothetical protein